jgi:hypothetical protein
MLLMRAAIYRTVAAYLIAWPLALTCVHVLHASHLLALAIGGSLGSGLTTLVHLAGGAGPGRG